jgi:hypothetical protein
MKKLVFAILVVFSINNAFAIELWNGFTTSMSKEEAIERAQKILSPDEIKIGDDYYIATVPSFDNLGYPSPQTWVRFNSKLPEYYSRGDENISMYFYREKLFCIIVSLEYRRNASPNEVVLTTADMAWTKYGKRSPDRTIRITNNIVPYNAYYWRLPGIDFYSDFNQFCFVDRVVRNKWLNE